MEQISEASGVPLLDGVPSLWEKFDAVTKELPNNIALVCTHQPPDLYGSISVPLSDVTYDQRPYLRWTYESLKNVTARLVAGLKAKGVEDRAIVITFLPNMAEYIVTMWATDRFGGMFVPLNPRNLTNEKEVVGMIENAMSVSRANSAVFIVASAEVALQVQSLPLSLNSKLIISTAEPSDSEWTSFSDVLARPQEKIAPLDGTHKPTSEAVLFTSGTTAVPKGCRWVHPGLSTVITQRLLQEKSGLPDPGDVMCMAVPNNHGVGYLNAHFTLGRGAALIYPGPGFEPEAMMDTMRREGCTHTCLVPTMVHALLGVKASSRRKIETLKGVVLAGSVVSSESMRLCAEELGSIGVENIFGMTEGAFALSGNRDDWRDLVEGDDVSVGTPIAGQKIRICAPGSKFLVKRGEAGEFHVSSPSLVPGYIGIDSDDFYIGDDGRRWFSTGDQAYIDDYNRIFIVGRYKDMIIRGGENISPAAIEALLDRIPELTALGIQVVGVADHIAGEVPIAIVNKTVDTEVIEQIRTTVLEKMGHMYIPDEVVSLETLGIKEYPKTMAGKIQKAKLRDLARKYRIAKETSLNNRDGNLTELESTIKEVWFRAVGHEVDLNKPISTFADSIITMQVRDRLSKKTARSISLADIVDNKTIAGLVKHLKNQLPLREGNPRLKRSLREGPPAPEDLIHLATNPELYESTKTYIEKHLSAYDLAWPDVEDVVPAHDFTQILNQRGTMDSWGFKMALLPNDKTAAEVRAALEIMLANNRILASFLMWDKQAFGSDVALHVLVRQKKEIFNLCITDTGKVRSVEELKNLAVRYPHPEHAARPGPLFHALIAEVEETGRAGLIIGFHHAVIDASYAMLFLEDLDQALGGAELQEHIDYKLWANSYFALGNTLDAKMATQWHIRRLKDLGKHRKALLDRASYANREGKGTEDELEFNFQAPGITALRQEYGHITAPVVFKAAVALLSISRTQHTHALFSNLEASRTRFPFVPTALSLLEGQQFEASDVAGPTIELVTNLVVFKREESVLEFLERMQDDQNNLTKYAAAPLGEVMSSLGEEVGAMVLESLESQVVSWAPGMWSTGTNPFQHFSQLNAIVRAKVGIAYAAGIGGENGDTFFIYLRGTAFNLSELERIAVDLGSITCWLTEKKNWNSCIDAFSSCLDAAIDRAHRID